MTDIALADAWAEVDRCHQAAGRFLYRLGAALNEAKNVTEHGRWQTELEQRGITERSAQRYMQVSRELTEAEFIDAGSFRKALAATQTRRSLPNPTRVSDSELQRPPRIPWPTSLAQQIAICQNTLDSCEVLLQTSTITNGVAKFGTLGAEFHRLFENGWNCALFGHTERNADGTMTMLVVMTRDPMGYE